MTRLHLFAIVALLIAPDWCHAEDAVPAQHSTVHIVFISQSPPLPMMGGEHQGKPIPMVRVGDLVLPAETIRPISIEIDGDFVGHALIGNYDINPVFVLPQGVHKFKFTQSGLPAVTSEIKVLGTRSKQYLIVKLPIADAPAKSDKVSKDKGETESAKD
jgi:hypothetical protein